MTGKLLCGIFLATLLVAVPRGLYAQSNCVRCEVRVAVGAEIEFCENNDQGPADRLHRTFDQGDPEATWAVGEIGTTHGDWYCKDCESAHGPCIADELALTAISSAIYSPVRGDYAEVFHTTVALFSSHLEWSEDGRAMRVLSCEGATSRTIELSDEVLAALGMD